MAFNFFEIDSIKQKCAQQKQALFLDDFFLICSLLNRVEIYLGKCSLVNYNFSPFNKPFYEKTFSLPRFFAQVKEELS